SMCVKVQAYGSSTCQLTYGSPGSSLAKTSTSWLSSAYIRQAKANCLWLFMHWMPWAFSLALISAGRSNAARIAMMAMTTSSSINVNAEAEVLDPSRGRQQGMCAEFISIISYRNESTSPGWVNPQCAPSRLTKPNGLRPARCRYRAPPIPEQPVALDDFRDGRRNELFPRGVPGADFRQHVLRADGQELGVGVLDALNEAVLPQMGVEVSLPCMKPFSPKPCLFSWGTRKGTAETRRAQRRERGWGRRDPSRS